VETEAEAVAAIGRARPLTEAAFAKQGDNRGLPPSDHTEVLHLSRAFLRGQIKQMAQAIHLW
jgi:hypothetical protein